MRKLELQRSFCGYGKDPDLDPDDLKRPDLDPGDLKRPDLDKGDLKRPDPPRSRSGFATL